MTNSSILGGTAAPARAPGTEVDLLGPSDSSDSGSDIQGELPMATSPDNPAEWGALTADAGSDSDAFGTGERAAAAGIDPRDGADIMPDRIIDPSDDAPEVTDPDLIDALDSLADDGAATTADGDDDAEAVDDESPSDAGRAQRGGSGR
jgi:hypothetical protein